MARPCDGASWRVFPFPLTFASSRLLFTFFDTTSLTKQHSRLMESTFRSLVGPARLASITSPVVHTAQDLVQTVKKASPATKKSSGKLSDEVREANNVSKVMSTSTPSDLIPRSRLPSPTRSASPEFDRDFTHDEEHDASTARNARTEKTAGWSYRRRR
jgi:hypothetical protein